MSGKTTEINKAVLSIFINGVHKLANMMGVAVLVIASVDNDVAVQFVGDESKSSGVKHVVEKTEISEFFSRAKIPLRFDIPAISTSDVNDKSAAA